MKIIIKRKKLEPVQRRHPWIFSGAVAQNLSDKPVEGDIVDVYSEDGEFLAIGYYENGSIAVRTLTYEQDAHIDAAFWHQRLESALASRRALPNAIADGPEASYRLVHGEGDFCPGLIIDIYGHVAVMQAHTVGIHRQRECICQGLVRLLPHLKGVYYKSETTLPPHIPEEERSAVLFGEVGETISAEYDLRFYP